MSHHRLLQELHCSCAHLAVFPVCRSASLPRVPLCCHVWKQAFALMYNTSLDPCFWYGCWQDSVKKKLVPKRRPLWDNCSYRGTKTTCLAFYLGSGVRICLRVYCWAQRRQETKEMPPTLWMWFSCVVEESSYCVVVNIIQVDSDWMTTWYGNVGLVEIALPCGNVIRLHVVDTLSQHTIYCCISTF